MSVELVDVGHVNGKDQYPSEWKRIRVVFHNFESLPAERGDSVKSPILECHGVKWQVKLFPGGGGKSSKEEAYISLFLHCLSVDEMVVKSASVIRIPSSGHKKKSKSFKSYEKGGKGYADFIKRKDVLDVSNDHLVNGDLIIEVDIQVMRDKPPSWTPTNTLSMDMLKLLDAADADSADITFEIGDGDGTKTRSRQGDHQLFYAHKTILSARSPALSSLADDFTSGAPIPITDVHPDLFRMLLRFIYGGEVPPNDTLRKDARAIVRAADRFGCTGLNLAAEAELAMDGITKENAAELILFADGTNCAMLKEAAMEYFVANAQDVMASDGYREVTESNKIMAEMMAAMAAGNKKRPAESSDSDGGRDYKRMRVATLRQKLDVKSLDVDGSKEMLVSRLEEADCDVIEVE